MRKAIFCLYMILLCASAGARNIWSGSQSISWNNNQSLTVSASEFSDTHVADILRLTIEFTGNTDWPQVSLRTGTWADLTSAGNIPISAQTTTVDYYLTYGMMTDLQNQGLLVTGIGYTLTSIDLIEGSGGDGMVNAVWIGNSVIPNDWSGYVALPSSCFKNASVGNYVRLHYKDLLGGAQAILRMGDWQEMPDMPSFVQLSGEHCDIAITPDMLAKLQSNGCIVQGVGFTLTCVDVIGAENLESLLLNVPVTHNWMWANGETPSFTLQVTNPMLFEQTFDVQMIVTNDKHSDSRRQDFNGQFIPESSSRTYEFALPWTLEPGFYECTLMANNEVARKFVFGIDAEKIVSAPDMQDDFASFWQKAKEDLAATAPQYTLTELTDKSTSRRKVYLVEMLSVSDEGGEGIVRAYYAEPTGNATYPAVVHYNGYDGGSYDPWCPGGDDNPEWAEIVVSTRGQLINNRPPYTNTYGDWFVYGFDNADHYYYRGAYMDAVRVIDFLGTREKVQQYNIFAEGASQGGALTLAAAALSDGRLNAIAPAVPFMGDFPDYFQITSWPANVANSKRVQLGMTEEEMYSMLSYFDVKNLATMITCPVYMDFSLQDNVCPPHTNWASYNNLKSTEKKYLVNPTLGHETAANWWNLLFSWFKENMKRADDIEAFSLHSTNDDLLPVYNLQGVMVAPAGTPLSTLPRGVYVIGGRKVTL